MQLDEQESESQWMEGLTQSHTGRKVCDYLGHLTSVLDDGDLSLECPIDQAVSFRRVLIRALERHSAPFGMPKKLPKFIAMVQLNGERMLLTPEISQLFKLLAHAPASKRAHTDAISSMMSMIKYREEHPECTLLMTYSAPFQVTLTNLWWDVRTLRRDPETLKVIDGEMAYQIGQKSCRAIGCTSALENDSSAETLEREVRAFEENISAVNLDIEMQHGMDKSDSSTPNDAKVQAAMSMARGLQTERKQLIADHAAEISEMRNHTEKLTRECEEESLRMYKQERENEASLVKEIARLTKEVEATVSSVSVHLADNELMRKTHRSDMNAAVIRKDEELKVIGTKLVATEGNLKLKDQECTRLSKQHASHTKKLEVQHQRSLDGMERKLQKATMAERAAKQEGGEITTRLSTLSSVMEGRDAEKEALEHQLDIARRNNRVFRAMMAVAGMRTAKATEKYAAEDASTLVKALQTVDDLHGERDSLYNENMCLKARIAELEAQTSPVVEKSDAGTMTVPISSVADLRLGELETQCVKLRDDLEAKKNECTTVRAELVRVKQKALKKQVPMGLLSEETNPAATSASCNGASAPVFGVPSSGSSGSRPYNIVTNVHVGGNTTAMASTDLGHSPEVDANVEHMIAQASTTLRILADAARDSSRHKQAAYEGWAQVRALQSFTGYQMPPQQWQTMPTHSQSGYRV